MGPTVLIEEYYAYVSCLYKRGYIMYTLSMDGIILEFLLADKLYTNKVIYFTPVNIFTCALGRTFNGA